MSQGGHLDADYNQLLEVSLIIIRETFRKITAWKMIWREKGNIKMDAGELDRMGGGWNYLRLVYSSGLWCQPCSAFEFQQHGVRYTNHVIKNSLKTNDSPGICVNCNGYVNQCH